MKRLTTTTRPTLSGLPSVLDSSSSLPVLDLPGLAGDGHGEFGDGADVAELCLYHHDPSQDDDAIDEKLRLASEMIAEKGSSVRCSAPAEGMSVRL